MSRAGSMTETIRIRIEPDKKAILTRIYDNRGTSISQAVRDFLDKEIESSADPLDRLNAIFASADAKLDAYGAPEPSVEDVAAYVERVREQRCRDVAATA